MKYEFKSAQLGSGSHTVWEWEENMVSSLPKEPKRSLEGMPLGRVAVT